MSRGGKLDHLLKSSFDSNKHLMTGPEGRPEGNSH